VERSEADQVLNSGCVPVVRRLMCLVGADLARHVNNRVALGARGLGKATAAAVAGPACRSVAAWQPRNAIGTQHPKSQPFITAVHGAYAHSCIV
jgi:hypothetical protein